MELTFLGTGSMVPTKERNVTSQFLEYPGEGILIDCGEGTQRQMNLAGINRNRVTKVLITHWHGDHVAGLIGLMQTIGHGVEGAKLMVFGPKGSQGYVAHMMKSVVFDVKIDVDVREFMPKDVETIFQTDSYRIEAIQLEHGIPCLGYSFIEKDTWTVDPKRAEAAGLKPGPQINDLKKKGMLVVRGDRIRIEDVAKKRQGKKISFIFDTRLCKACYDLAQDADVLVCEATHALEHEEKASKYHHLTTKDAATIANVARVKRLVATHFSQRYKTTEKLEDELTSMFPGTVLARDMLRVHV